MAIGQALLTKPPKPKIPQQQRQEQVTKRLNNNTVIQDQSLKFEQSLELVRTLLGASIGCLSFLRGLLPEECFVEKRYGGKSSAAMSYRSFTSDIDDESFKKGSAGSGTRVKRLRRGYSGEADQLLDWLEIGIFDALQKGYLKAVQLAIYVDKEHPEIIVESYTFSFSYREKEDGTSAIGLRVTDINGRGVTVEDANKNLQLMMRRLIVITQNLPPLPDQRWLTIRLHYLDHTPSDYNPPSFVRVSANASPLQFHENDANDIERLEVGSLNAGFHAISLKISSVNNTESQERPKRRRGLKIIHADTDIEAPLFTTDSSQTTPRGCSNATGISETSEGLSSGSGQEKISNESPVTEKRQASGNDKNIKRPPVHLPQTSGRAGRNTQEKISLRGMLRPVVREDDVTETQPLADDPGASDNQNSLFDTELLPTLHFETQAVDRIQNPIHTSANPTNISSGIVRTGLDLVLSHPLISGEKGPPLGVSGPTIPTHRRQSTRILQKVDNVKSADKTVGRTKLSKVKIIELKLKEKSKDIQNSSRKSRTIDGDEWKGETHEGRINCECGEDKPEGNMICCDNCDEWQHTDCYGFISAKDSRIPDHHVCYSCLLGANEGKILEEMRNMALFRRALKTIWSVDVFPSSNKVFANKLGCDLPTALQITKRLESEGFIAHDVAKSKLWRKRAYEILKTNETKSLMDAEYFDPLKKISHHFENSSSANITRKSPLGEIPLVEPLPETFLNSLQLMDAGIQDSQELERGFGESNAAPAYKSKTRVTDHDADSTADEEENMPILKHTRKDITHYDKTIDRSGNSGLSSNRADIASHNSKPKTRAPFEIVESPEPMEIDSVGKPQAPLNADRVLPKAINHKRLPLMNVGGALHDIFVGEELGQRDF
ncbi:HORMA-domain-containing protein [Morchella conica CCBAS932]|uniref:HORMA-domain-containing protein n=1 Tax=Morchella conica CCBAS932 TaxID=1392247 RepID=A0A3N4KCZ1_9PEZI|nr:HORMA-domain-containing protein [Morchella conica CCBAS932]